MTADDVSRAGRSWTWAANWYITRKHALVEGTSHALCSDYTMIWPDGWESDSHRVPPSDSDEVRAMKPCGLCLRKVKSADASSAQHAASSVADPLDHWRVDTGGLRCPVVSGLAVYLIDGECSACGAPATAATLAVCQAHGGDGSPLTSSACRGAIDGAR